MSYIKVELGGKERGLKFNGAADDMFRSKGSSTIPYKNGYAIFYAGLIGNCAAKDIEPDFEWEEVTEWVDELVRQDKGDIIIAVTEAYNKSQEYKKLLPKEELQEEKKSEPMKKLKKAS